MAYALTFGTYTFPVGLYVAGMDANRPLPMAKLPRAAGARVVAGYLTGKKITVRGGQINTAGLRTVLDGLKAALAQGPCNFTTDSDRFYRNCQIENYSDTYDPTGWNRIVSIQFDVLTGDPYAYDTTPSSANLITSGNTAAVGGNAPAAPLFTLTMGSTATLGLILTNTTTGEACTLNGAVVNGDVLVIDSLTQSVTKNGVDAMAMFDGLWLSLAPGVTNTFTLALSTGTISAKTVGWNNRYY